MKSVSKITQKERRLRRQVESLRADKKRYFEEMVARGEEVTCMIRVFLSVSSRLPAGPRERIEQLARRYAERNDSDRFVLDADFGRLDFFEGQHRYKEDPRRAV